MLNSPESVPAAPSVPMTKRGRPAKTPAHEEIPGQAERLRRLRSAYHFETAAAFAAFLGVPPTTYNSFENGAPLSRSAIFKLCSKIPGLTSDWLYFNKADGLPYEVRRQLGLLEGPRGNAKT